MDKKIEHLDNAAQAFLDAHSKVGLSQADSKILEGCVSLVQHLRTTPHPYASEPKATGEEPSGDTFIPQITESRIAELQRKTSRDGQVTLHDVEAQDILQLAEERLAGRSSAQAELAELEARLAAYEPLVRYVGETAEMNASVRQGLTIHTRECVELYDAIPAHLRPGDHQ